MFYRSQVSVSTASNAMHSRTEIPSSSSMQLLSASAPPPPGMDAFPSLAKLPEDGDADGDDVLDALLGMDVPVQSRTVKPGEIGREVMNSGCTLSFLLPTLSLCIIQRY